MRGGPRPNSGGARPGAGRKLPPSAIAWRDFWRGKFNSPATRTYLWAQAKRLLEKENDASLVNKLIDKTFPTPSELDLNVNALPPDLVFTSRRAT